jgi:excisionase family DNA binding protein
MNPKIIVKPSRRPVGCRLAKEPTPAKLISMVDASDASEQLGVSLMTIRRMVADGQLRSVQVRTRVMVLSESIEELLKGAR